MVIFDFFICVANENKIRRRKPWVRKTC